MHVVLLLGWCCAGLVLCASAPIIWWLCSFGSWSPSSAAVCALHSSNLRAFLEQSGHLQGRVSIGLGSPPLGASQPSVFGCLLQGTCGCWICLYISVRASISQSVFVLGSVGACKAHGPCAAAAGAFLVVLASAGVRRLCWCMTGALWPQCVFEAGSKPCCSWLWGEGELGFVCLRWKVALSAALSCMPCSLHCT